MSLVPMENYFGDNLESSGKRRRQSSRIGDNLPTSNFSQIDVVLAIQPTTMCIALQEKITQWEDYALAQQAARDIENAIKLKFVPYVSDTFRDDLVDSENEIDVESIEAKTITNFSRDMKRHGTFSDALNELDMDENTFKDKFVPELRALKTLFNGIAHFKVDTNREISKKDSYKRIISQYCQDVALRTLILNTLDKVLTTEE